LAVFAVSKQIPGLFAATNDVPEILQPPVVAHFTVVLPAGISSFRREVFEPTFATRTGFTSAEEADVAATFPDVLTVKV
jgi:hypothetical protein